MAQIDKLFRVDGLVAVVTGGGTGLGRMMARALASSGARKVYVIGRHTESLDETAVGFDNVVPIRGDVTDKDSLDSVTNLIRADAAFINVLVHFWSYSAIDMNETFALNNTGGFFTLVAFLDLLHAGNEAQNRTDLQSQVIFTASIAGFARSLATGVVYIASKAGTIQQTKMLSSLLAKWRIRVNAIAPGIYPSEMTSWMLKDPRVLDTIPAHRTGSEDDMRGAVLFLTSRAGAYVNGEILVTDGGRLGQMQGSY